MSKYKYSLSLQASARQFLESAVQFVKSNNENKFKYALFHTITALELLAKACIALEDPFLIATKNVSNLEFKQGRFQSINIDQAFKLLKRIANFSLTTEQNKSITRLKAARNRFIHFLDNATVAETKVLVASGIELFFELHETEFNDIDDPWQAKSMAKLAEELSEFQDFVTLRMGSLTNQLKSLERPKTRHFSECTRCLQEADVLIDNELVCLFCCNRINIREATEIISEDQSVDICPICHKPSVAKFQFKKNGQATYECFCCGYFRGPEITWADHKGVIIARLRTFS